VGKVQYYGVSNADKLLCKTANFKVTYSKKETDNALKGTEARELTSHNYGRDEWWMLLDQVGSS
jgi:hypothetical protein